MKRCKTIAKRFSRFMHRYINGTRGVISILMALLMVPFITIAGGLINAARINSAIAVFDEALCNASNSTLGTYDEFLRSRFGLLAMSQNYPEMGTNYTAEDFITETFQFYMEENLGVLSNTYTDAVVSAAGVYPLADSDVLLTQVLEYGKYSIPTKLIIDGLDLDDLIGEFTSKLSAVTNVLNTITAGVNVASSLITAQEKMNTLVEAINTATTAKKNYDTAYNEFCAIVSSHNSLIDERNREVAACENAVTAAENNLTTATSNFENAKANYQWIVDEINALKNEKDAQGKPVDNSKKIAELEKTYASELEIYNNAKQAKSDAETALSTAKSNLQSTISSYNTKISNKRTEVSNKKTDYVTKINDLATAINNVKTGINEAQDALMEVINSGTSFTKNVVTTVTAEQNRAEDKSIEEMKKNKQAATDRGDNTAAYLWDDKIQEANQTKNENSNTGTILNAGLDAQTSAESALNDFAKQEIASAYEKVYEELIKLKGNVSKIAIPTGLNKMGDVTSYYYDFTPKLSAQTVKTLLSDLANELTGENAKSSFLKTIKALVGFVKAIFSMTLLYDPELNGTLNKSLYSGIGGLPSSVSQSSLKSGYEDVDSAKSNYYKQLLGAYSASGMTSGSVDTIESTINSIMTNLDTITEVTGRKWGISNVLQNLGDIFKAIFNIVAGIIKLAGNILQVIATAVYQKALLAGYIAYNVPNRCTYTDEAFTGEKPSLDSTGTGYGFKGAEAEYIMIGGTSEKANQTSIFSIIYGLRILLDIAFVIPNQEVASIASAAGAATFGIGTVVVYILYFLAEPLVDTVIICNGSSVPMFKTKLYLTPSGVTDLIGKFYKLKLSDDQKNKAYAKVVDVMSLGTTGDSFPQNYADAVSSGISDPSLNTDGGLTATAKETLEFDYSKTLLILMMFWNSDNMVKRLGDVVQMEATIKYGGESSTFRLTKSFTYLRASGSFTSSEFIKISDSDGLTSTERVVYRGY